MLKERLCCFPERPARVTYEGGQGLVCEDVFVACWLRRLLVGAATDLAAGSRNGCGSAIFVVFFIV